MEALHGEFEALCVNNIWVFHASSLFEWGSIVE
jgi:hypothetical protein